MTLPLIATFAYITPYNDYDIANTFIAGNLLPTSSMVVLLLLSLIINPSLRRVSPKTAFSTHELAAIWGLIVIPSGIAAAGLWRYIIPQLPNLYYRESPQNRWDQLLIPYAPSWLVITDKSAARSFYEGNGGQILWSDWSGPLSFWFSFSVALILSIFCLSALLRRQWTEREQFTFPLAQMPYELVRQPAPNHFFPPILYTPSLWVGFFASAFLHTFSGLQTYYPAVPALRRFRSLGEYISGFPWDAIAGTNLHVYPAAIGLTYLLTTEVSFSLWFFYVLERLQQVLFALYGWSGLGYSATDFVQYQQSGAILGLLFLIGYSTRHHWVLIIRQSLTRSRNKSRHPSDVNEPLPYTVAFWGFLTIFVCLFTVLVLLGMDWPLALCLLVMAYGFHLAVSWIATNGGMVMVQMRTLPFDPLIALFGTKGFSPRGILMMCLLQEAYAYDQREFLMPSLLNAMKMAQLTGLNIRSLTGWGFIGVVTACAVSLFSWLKLGYTKGAVTLTRTATFAYHANYPYTLAAQYIDPGMPSNSFRSLAMAVGLFGFIGLYFLRLRFTLPFHPIGWIVCRGWAMEQFWLMILIGWFLKAMIVHYGGLTFYRSARPFFIGIIFGDMTAAALYTIIGFATGRSYPVMPL